MLINGCSPTLKQGFTCCICFRMSVQVKFTWFSDFLQIKVREVTVILIQIESFLLWSDFFHRMYRVNGIILMVFNSLIFSLQLNIDGRRTSENVYRCDRTLPLMAQCSECGWKNESFRAMSDNCRDTLSFRSLFFLLQFLAFFEVRIIKYFSFQRKRYIVAQTWMRNTCLSG